MATVPDLSGNRPNNAPYQDAHIPSKDEQELELLEEIADNTAP